MRALRYWRPEWPCISVREWGCTSMQGRPHPRAARPERLAFRGRQAHHGIADLPQLPVNWTVAELPFVGRTAQVGGTTGPVLATPAAADAPFGVIRADGTKVGRGLQTHGLHHPGKLDLQQAAKPACVPVFAPGQATSDGPNQHQGGTQDGPGDNPRHEQIRRQSTPPSTVARRWFDTVETGSADPNSEFRELLIPCRPTGPVQGSGEPGSPLRPAPQARALWAPVRRRLKARRTLDAARLADPPACA